MRGADATLAQMALLALWLGSALFFVAVVAPAAFAALPTRALAGALVGRVLPALLYGGIVVGIGVAALEWVTRRRVPVTVRFTAGLAVAVACAIAQLGIAPRIERLRAVIGGTLDLLPPGDARRVAFGRLHGLSVLWLGVATVAAAIALVSSIRAQRIKP